jgi:hypothetical protein
VIPGPFEIETGNSISFSLLFDRFRRGQLNPKHQEQKEKAHGVSQVMIDMSINQTTSKTKA